MAGCGIPALRLCCAGPRPALRPLASSLHSSSYSLPSGQGKSGFYFPRSRAVSTMRPVHLPYKGWRGFSVCFELFLRFQERGSMQMSAWGKCFTSSTVHFRGILGTAKTGFWQPPNSHMEIQNVSSRASLRHQLQPRQSLRLSKARLLPLAARDAGHGWLSCLFPQGDQER